MDQKAKAFTIVELLTVIAIIALLIGLILPSLTKARLMARETQERARLRTIGMGLDSFRNDLGYYPDSTNQVSLLELYNPGPPPNDQGAHRLFEALMGLDLAGHHVKRYYGHFASGLQDRFCSGNRP